MAYKAGVIGSASYLMNPVVQILRGRVFYATLPSDEAACSRILPNNLDFAAGFLSGGGGGSQ